LTIKSLYFASCSKCLEPEEKYNGLYGKSFAAKWSYFILVWQYPPKKRQYMHIARCFLNPCDQNTELLKLNFYDVITSLRYSVETTSLKRRTGSSNLQTLSE